MTHSIKYHRSVKKYIKKIQKPDRLRLINSMQSLKAAPYPYGAKKINDTLHRIRVGRYRVIYSVQDDVLMVAVCRIARRNEATYRNLQQLVRRVEKMSEEGEE